MNILRKDWGVFKLEYGFNRTPMYSFGVEEEFQLYSMENLKPIDAKEVIFSAKDERVKRELLTNMVEINTYPCETIDSAREQLGHLRGQLSEICNDRNIFVVAMGIYPFASKEDVKMDVGHAQERAKLFLDERIKGNKNYIFSGTHFHISMGSFEEALLCMDGFTNLSNLLSIINSNSRYFDGNPSGYNNYRRILWNDIGGEMLKIKKEKTTSSFFKKYDINTINPRLFIF